MNPNLLIAQTTITVFALLLNSLNVDAQDSSVATSIGLKQHSNGNFLVGAGVSDEIAIQQKDWPLLTQNFEIVTPENCMKPQAIQAVEGVFQFRQCDAFVQFAEDKKLQIVGHCLVWAKDDRTPEWWLMENERPTGKALLLKRLKDHIDAVAGRYGDRIAAWDVVNEALSDDESDYLRDSIWTRVTGEEFIVRAFQYARENAPKALLIYNDYNCDNDGKCDKLIRLIKSLKSQDAPVDAVGLQGHYELDSIPYEGLESLLLAMRKLRIKVIISELDIDVVPRGRWWADGNKYREELKSFDPYSDGCPSEILARQADQYAQLFDLFCKYDDVIQRVSFWNLHDGQSWLNYFPWNRVNHPLLFDRNSNPKPAYTSVVTTLDRFQKTKIKEAGEIAKIHANPRVIVTTDGEVDDRSSMVRFLLYACDFDVAGIVQVNSKFQKQGHSDKKWIDAQLDAYESVLPNLRKHNPNFPDSAQLRSVMRVGNETEADLWIAPPDMQTKDTQGAQLIIDTLLDNDPRPVHVLSWGGANTTASALWKLKTEYSKEKFDYAVSRIRIYCIWYQDGGGEWIQKNISGAYIYEAYKWDNVWDYESYDHARKQGKLSANPPTEQEVMKPAWFNEHIKNGHGPLGAMTPQKYISEGDTPSFFNLVNNGLAADKDYTLGGWGGRGAFDDMAFPNHISDKTITDDGDSHKMFWRWVLPAQNDFAARMDWCVKEFKEANHAPVAKVIGELHRDVQPGESVTLQATASDPDGNKLTFKWWQYSDADSAVATVDIANAESLDSASFIVPNESKKQVHIILEVTDNGTPALVGYQPVICNIK